VIEKIFSKDLGYLVLGLGLVCLAIFGGTTSLPWSVSYTTYKFDTPTGWISKGEYAVKGDKYLISAENVPEVNKEGDRLYDRDILIASLDKKYTATLKSGILKDGKEIIYQIEADYPDERVLVVELPQTFNVSGLTEVKYLGETAYNEFLHYEPVKIVNNLVAENDRDLIYTAQTEAKIIREEETLSNYKKLGLIENYPQPKKIVRSNIFKSQVGQAAIAHDGTTNSGALASVSSSSFSHSNTAGNYIYVIVGSFDSTDADRQVTGITYNGGALTFLANAEETTAANTDVDIWGQTATSTGSRTVAVTFNAVTTSAAVFATTLTGVDTADPIDVTNTASILNDSTPTINATTTVADVWLASGIAYGKSNVDNVISADAPATSRGVITSVVTPGGSYGSSSRLATAINTYTMAWTMGGSNPTLRDGPLVVVGFTPSVDADAYTPFPGSLFLKGLSFLRGGFRLGGQNSTFAQGYLLPQNLGSFGDIEDFESDTAGLYGQGYIWYSGWGANPNDDVIGRASSTMDIIDEGSNNYLEISVNDDIFDGTASFNSPNSLANLDSVLRVSTLALGGYRLSPKADTLRMRLRISAGDTIGIAFGSPVSQLGNSDVLTGVKYFSSGDYDDCTDMGDTWYQCDFDLNENIIRNDRRANYSGGVSGATGNVKNALGDEIIHYTRWVQEPLALYLVTYNNDVEILNGNPVLHLDDFEIINEGQGKDFPRFSNPALVALVDNFETSISNAFTVNFNWPTSAQSPAILRSTLEGNTGNNSLEIESDTAEELSWTGISAANGDGANAVSFEMKVEYGAATPSEHAIEFIALANPTGGAFNWSGLDSAGSYDYELSEASTASLDFAVYHARRIIPIDKWVVVTIPFADFAAAYGSGTMLNHHKEQYPLEGDEISVVGLQTSFGQAGPTTTISIDSIKYVTVPGTAEQLRSYYQPQVYTP